MVKTENGRARQDMFLYELHRWDWLVEHHKPASKVPAFLNVTDIAGKFTTFVIRAAMTTSKA